MGRTRPRAGPSDVGSIVTSIGFALAAQIAIAGTAHAQPVDEQLTKEGIELRREGRDAEALAVFQHAFAVDGSPRTRAQVALAEQALGFWADAERDLSAALAAGDGPWFAEHSRTLHLALDNIRAALATLHVETNVAGAELRVNGSPAGLLPLRSPVRVAAGTVTIEVRAPGYVTQVRTIQIVPQTVVRETIELIPLPESPPVRTPPEQASWEPPRRRPAPGPRVGAWASLAGAVALGTGGGVAVLVRDSNAAMYNDDTRCFYGGQTRDQRCSGDRQAALTAQTVAVASFSAAAALAGASIVLFTRAPRTPSPSASAFRCTLGLGVTCDASF